VCSISNDMEQYKGYHISDINSIGGTVTFTNGDVLSRGEVVGDVSETDMRRIQIREIIISHFEKEKRLWHNNNVSSNYLKPPLGGFFVIYPQ